MHREAKSSVLSDSDASNADGPTVAMRQVFAEPPTEPQSSLVSLESRYGTCAHSGSARA